MDKSVLLDLARKVVAIVPEVMAYLDLPELDILEVKTLSYYRSVFIASVNALYNDKITANEFVDKLSTLVYNQMFAAWREGMVNLGLDPKANFTQEMADIVSQIADAEMQYLRDFSQAVIDARINETLSGVLARAETWANRYLDVVNRAMIFCKPQDLYVWRLGATEQHCVDCAGYSGRIMTGAEWAKEKQPQSPELACHGYNCDCSLERVVKT